MLSWAAIITPLVFLAMLPGFAGLLVVAVVAVATHGPFVPVELEQAMHRHRPGSGADALSPRELEVLRLILDGVRISDIAEQLGISLKTASTFKSRIHAKTRCSTLDQLIGYAVKHQLLPTSLGGAPIDGSTV